MKKRIFSWNFPIFRNNFPRTKLGQFLGLEEVAGNGRRDVPTPVDVFGELEARALHLPRLATATREGALLFEDQEHVAVHHCARNKER